MAKLIDPIESRSAHSAVLGKKNKINYYDIIASLFKLIMVNYLT